MTPKINNLDFLSGLYEFFDTKFKFRYFDPNLMIFSNSNQ